MEGTKILTCPNCGANITNTQNCEYCGSLLVRFVDKGIDISKTSYLDKSRLSGKLLKALKLALSMQKSTSESVAIDIYQRKQHNGLSYYKVIGCVLRSGYAAFMDLARIPCESSTGLCIAICFEKYQNEELEKFKSLDCFQLFNERPCIRHTDNKKVVEYFIDFGEDADGAAQILTEITTEVYDASEDELECYVNSGDNIEATRTKFQESANWFDGDWDEFLQRKIQDWNTRWAEWEKTKIRAKKSKEDQKKINRSRFYIASVLLVAALGLYMAFDKLDSLYYGPGGEEWMWTMRCICIILAGLCLLVAVLLYLSILGIDKDYV